MAAIAASNIVQLQFNFGKLSIDGFPIEMYRILGGFSAADTATIAPNRFDQIKAAFCQGAVSDLPTEDPPGTNVFTSVTLTMRQSAAAGQSVDVILVGRQRN